MITYGSKRDRAERSPPLAIPATESVLILETGWSKGFVSSRACLPAARPAARLTARFRNDAFFRLPLSAVGTSTL